MPNNIYNEALRLGQKDIKVRREQGLSTELPALDDVLINVSICARTSLGLVDIPTEFIIGTKTRGRTSSFAPNFMPILESTTEFASKWMNLCASQIEEGIHEPIKAYEFMNRFYVLEGNKRISVLKYFGAGSVPGYVTRLVPVRDDTTENKVYYEFLDFYNATGLNVLDVTRPGIYEQIANLVGYRKYTRWSMEDIVDFRSCYNRFSEKFKERCDISGEELYMHAGDAIPEYMRIFGYRQLIEQTPDEIRKNLDGMWEELKLADGLVQTAVLLEPDETIPKQGVISKILPTGRASVTKIAFVHAKDPESSVWVKAHESAREYLEGVFDGKLETRAYYDVPEREKAKSVLEEAIESNADLIFVTAPELINACMEAAILHPQVRIFACSPQATSSSVRTYYPRMYEPKYLSGMLAGIMSDTGKIGYIANYPIYSIPASINAFALGVAAVNPEAKIYLEWSQDKKNVGINLFEKFFEMGCTIVSDQDLAVPGQATRRFGIYRTNGERPVNLGAAAFDWGRFYEKIIRSLQEGAWSDKEKKKSPAAINYFWGMKAGVVDFIWSNEIPQETARLLAAMKTAILANEFTPFTGDFAKGHTETSTDADEWMSPEEIIAIDWLAENIVGKIPTVFEVTEKARLLVETEGVYREENK